MGVVVVVFIIVPIFAIYACCIKPYRDSRSKDRDNIKGIIVGVEGTLDIEEIRNEYKAVLVNPICKYEVNGLEYTSLVEYKKVDREFYMGDVLELRVKKDNPYDITCVDEFSIHDVVPHISVAVVMFMGGMIALSSMFSASFGKYSQAREAASMGSDMSTQKCDASQEYIMKSSFIDEGDVTMYLPKNFQQIKTQQEDASGQRIIWYQHNVSYDTVCINIMSEPLDLESMYTSYEKHLEKNYKVISEKPFEIEHNNNKMYYVKMEEMTPKDPTKPAKFYGIYGANKETGFLIIYYYNFGDEACLHDLMSSIKF